VYVSDVWNDRVQVFDFKGRFVRAFGFRGSGDGMLAFPMGLAVSVGGEVYVADTCNHRVQVFRGDGVFVRKWGSHGIGEDNFDCPTKVALKGDVVFVVDCGNQRIKGWDAKGNSVVRWNVADVYDMCWDECSGLYYVTTLRGRLHALCGIGVMPPGLSIPESGCDGDNLCPLYTTTRVVSIPTSGCVCCDVGGVLYVTTRVGVEVVRYDERGFRTINSVKVLEEDDGGTRDGLSGVTVDGEGNVYVYGTHCVYVMS